MLSTNNLNLMVEAIRGQRDWLLKIRLWDNANMNPMPPKGMGKHTCL
jgi:hypothetical protein